MSTWESSANQSNKVEQLYLYNSLTRKKELFSTIDGKNLKWYACGPTVYDESHMGHARCYISTDILRRVLQDYFKYEVTFCMNITDIDDKIILRARKGYLFDEYKKKNQSIEDLVKDVKEAYTLTEEKANNEHDKDKKEMHNRILSKAKATLEKYEKTATITTDKNALKDELLLNSADILSTWLDKHKGKDVNDNSIFSQLPRHYEGEFHKDMAALNIQPPSVLTRVSEYVPEVIEFIEKIIKNGYAYESKGSVYFNTVKFDETKDHYYAKLLPEAFGDSQALAEGEGALSDQTTEKLNVTDFALWKFSKAGEPSWDSPWGKGRPGWHIECSAMAGAIFDSSLDIHSGGIDLKFPHHDNEIAQSEAAFSCNNWVNFFLHSGHLHIQGCKMSKSLKNFITIKDALKKYTSRQIRILFLLHSWKDTLDYSDHGMDSALSFEKSLKEFFFRVKDFSRNARFDEPNGYNKFTKVERELLDLLQEKKSLIHQALCDSINTSNVLKEISNLISSTNSYMSNNYNLPNYNHNIVRDVSLFITNLMKIFGVIDNNESIGFQSSGGSESLNQEQILMPYLNALSKFRDDIRVEARLTKQIEILKLCDKLRDDVLPDLGVLIEDLSDRTVVKLCDRESLLKEKEQKRLTAERKKAEELKRQQELEQERREKEAKKSIPPNQLFIKETDKYSKFDEKGIPTMDAEGKEISKSSRKKLEKAYEVQVKNYEEYLMKNQKTNGTNEN